MKHSVKKTLSLLLAACCLFGAIGCTAANPVFEIISQSTPAYESSIETEPVYVPDAANETQSEQPVSDVPAAPAAPQVSDGQIMALYWDLFDASVRAAQNNDYEGFKALYYDTDEQVIRNDFNFDWRKYNDYDRRDGFVAGSKDGYYWIVRTFYIVSGTHPNTRRSSSDGYVLARYENGKLQYAYGAESQTVLGTLSNEIVMNYFESAYPGFGNERAKAVNGSSFYGYNYLFLNSDAAYSGSYDTNLIMMWQTENGDVKAAVWYANGTNVNIGAYRTKIKVTDDSIGTIIDETIDETVSIRAGHSLVRVFTIPASRVKTGTQTWTTMHAQTETNY